MSKLRSPVTVEATGLTYVSGPLVFVQNGSRYPLGAVVEVIGGDGYPPAERPTLRQGKRKP